MIYFVCLQFICVYIALVFDRKLYAHTRAVSNLFPKLEVIFPEQIEFVHMQNRRYKFLFPFLGLITYRETALLYEPNVSPLSSKNRVASVVSHELSHQWFGNLVSMSIKHAGSMRKSQPNYIDT